MSEAGPLPFELRVLEALLDETARQFERRQRRLELLAMSIEEDIQKTLKQNGADLQRLLPIQRCRARSPLPCSQRHISSMAKLSHSLCLHSRDVSAQCRTKAVTLMAVKPLPCMCWLFYHGERGREKPSAMK